MLREGCVGETLSVLSSARQVDDDAATSGMERALLRGIVRDEFKHSALAWRTLAWASRNESLLAARLHLIVDELDEMSLDFVHLVRPLARCIVGHTLWSEIVNAPDAPLLDSNSASLYDEAIRTLLATFAAFC